MTPEAGQVSILLLGGFAVTVDGRDAAAATWPGRRAVELVQLLALADGHRMLRDQVVGALWPQLSAGVALAELRQAADHARRALGRAGAIGLQDGWVALFPGAAVETDVDRFRRAARQALFDGDAEACRQAAGLYPGELLPGSVFEEWTQLARTELRSLYLALLRAGRQWTDVVEADPTDEGAYRHLMREALASGAPASALRWYERLRAALERDLGVAPGPPSRRLHDLCVARLEPSPPFAGRATELAAVVATLRAGGTDPRRAVAVCGPPGIGKSAFGREVVRLAGEEKWSTVAIALTESPEPYLPIRRVIEEVLARRPEVLDRAGSHTRSVLAALAPAAGPAAPPAGPLSRHQVTGAVRRALLGLGDGRPVLLFVDDLHLADQASVDTILQLVQSGGPLLVVLAYQAESVRPALGRALATLERAGHLTRVDLGPLPDDDVGGLVRQAARGEVDAGHVAGIVGVAAGNPFAALEMARVAPDAPAGPPPSLADAIAARLDDVDARTLAILKRMAVATDDVDGPTLMALTWSSEDEVFAVLDRAVGAGVLVADGGRYRFRHDLIRRALLEQVAPYERLAVHRDTARRLAARGASPAAVARHWLAGGRPDLMIEPLLDAARRATELGAFADAVAALDLVLEHDRANPAALRLRAESLDLAGDASVVRAYDAAAARAGPDDVADLRAERALAQLDQGDVAGALRAIEGVEPEGAGGRLAEALTYSGAAAMGYVDPAIATAKAARCRRLALQSGDAAAIGAASWAHAAAAHARGRLQESVMVDLRETAGAPHLAGPLFDGQLCVTQWLLYGARPYADVVGFADAVVAEAWRIGAAHGRAFGVTLRGQAKLLSGRLDDAARDLAEGARLYRRIAGAAGEALALHRLAELAASRGDRLAAAALLDEALDLARATAVGRHLFDRIYGARISLAVDPGDGLLAVDAADAAVRGPLETCPSCRITRAVPAAIAAARAGDLPRAREHEQVAGFLAERVVRLPAWRAAVEEVRGWIAGAEGDRARAAGRFAAAAAGYAGAGQPLDHERCRGLAGAAS